MPRVNDSYLFILCVTSNSRRVPSNISSHWRSFTCWNQIPLKIELQHLLKPQRPIYHLTGGSTFFLVCVKSLNVYFLFAFVLYSKYLLTVVLFLYYYLHLCLLLQLFLYCLYRLLSTLIRPCHSGLCYYIIWLL